MTSRNCAKNGLFVHSQKEKKKRKRAAFKRGKLWNWVRHKAPGGRGGSGYRFDFADAQSIWDPILGMPPYTFYNVPFYKGYSPG